MPAFPGGLIIRPQLLGRCTKPTIEWVNHIKDKGNEANHEITIAKSDEAKELLAFVEMLLKLIYEFPATMRKKHPSSEAE